MVDIFGEVVKDLFETFGGVDILFLQGVKDTHQGATRMGASIRGRAETDLAGDDGGTEVSFREVIFGRDLSALCPMIETMSVIPEEILNMSDSEMESGSLDSDQDLGFGFGSLLIKLGLADGLVPQTHGSGQERGHDIYKGFDFLRVRELLFEVLDLSEQMGITILEREYSVSGRNRGRWVASESNSSTYLAITNTYQRRW